MVVVDANNRITIIANRIESNANLAQMWAKLSQLMATACLRLAVKQARKKTLRDENGNELILKH
jgi:hypothetical protein